MKSPAKPYQIFLVLTMVPVGVAAFILKLALFFYWLAHNPTAPRPEVGEIYPLNNHGHIFYVTQTQSSLQDWLMGIFYVFAFGGGILNFYWKVIRNPYDNFPKKMY
jgi:hypothetical protein